MLHKTFRNLQRSKIKLNAKMYLKCIKTYLLRLQKRKKLKKKKFKILLQLQHLSTPLK